MGYEEGSEYVLKNLRHLEAVFKNKSELYGRSWYDPDPTFRTVSMFTETNAKYRRLRKMVWDDVLEHGEVQNKVMAADAFLDAALYCIMGASSLMEQMNQTELQELGVRLDE